MGAKEILLGKDWEQKSRGEKLARISKIADMATIVGALVFWGLAPLAAMFTVQASVVTYVGAEVYEQHKKRKKKK